MTVYTEVVLACDAVDCPADLRCYSMEQLAELAAFRRWKTFRIEANEDGLVRVSHYCPVHGPTTGASDD